MANAPFSINVRVYYEDTDAGGIVYYANYLKFCERARTDWLRGMKVSQRELLSGRKQGFVVRSIKGNYLRSAVLDDYLTVTCIPVKARFASLCFYQQVFNQKQELLFELQCDIAFMDFEKGKPAAMPKEELEYAQSFIPEDVSSYEVR